MNEDQLNATSVEYGKRIGYFLDNLDIPHSVKNAIFEIIEILDANQVDMLAASLEQALVDQVAIESTQEFNDQVETLNKDTVSQLEAIINN